MADVYTTLRDGSYLLHQPFYLPTKNGPVWAIAFTTAEGTLVTAGISVALTLIFISLWKLICFIAVLYPGSTTRRRHLALAMLWNSNDSWFAFEELAKYAFHFIRSPHDFAYGLLFSLLALTIWGGSLSLGIVGPSLLQIGTAAPVRPSETFYPRNPYDDVIASLGYLSILAPSFLRAIGSVEASEVTLRKRVNIRSSEDINSTWDIIHHYSYDYSLTGVDLGLQFGSDILLTVNGSCTTEFEWWNATNDAQDQDEYILWNNTENQSWEYISITEDAIQEVPKAIFRLPSNATQNSLNTSFAILISSAHRASSKQGDDPWYRTELRPETAYNHSDTDFWIQRGVPVLSCWEKDTWSYKSKEVGTINDLKAVSSLKVKPALLDVLTDALQYPMIMILGRASGNSALKSSAISSLGFINAEASKIIYDLERLVLASFVCTRNLLLDTTLHQGTEGVENILRDGRNQPANGAGDFVLSNPNFQTFSMVGLILLFTLLAALWIIQLTIHTIHRLHTDDKKTGPTKGRLMLFKALPAAQLFRRIYEPKKGGQEDKHWECAAHFPSEYDEAIFKWAKCEREDIHCKGHIDSELVASRPGYTTQLTGDTLRQIDNTPAVPSGETEARVRAKTS